MSIHLVSGSGAAVDAARRVLRAATEIHAQVAQGRAQTLLDHRVIEDIFICASHYFHRRGLACWNGLVVGLLD